MEVNTYTLRGDKEYPFSGVTKSGRVWRRVPESRKAMVPEGAGKRWCRGVPESDGAGGGRKAMVPEGAGKRCSEFGSGPDMHNNPNT